MRKAFAQCVGKELAENELCTLLLGDIGVHAFRESFGKFPHRIFNIGILEQSMVSIAAGMALEGLIPTIHTIAPFVVERAYEQIKVDFGYQKLRGNLITVGSSVDYAALGCTHHCPGDVAILLNIPDVQIIVPGHGGEFTSLYEQTSRNDSFTYSRLSELSNSMAQPVTFGKGVVIKEGSKATVICVGPTLDMTVEACRELDVNILYFTTIFPFDFEIIRSICTNGKILLVEPFYKHTLTPLLMEYFEMSKMQISSVGVPRAFLRNYGTVASHYEGFGLTSTNIKATAQELIDA
jgi:transketolase